MIPLPPGPWLMHPPALAQLKARAQAATLADMDRYDDAQERSEPAPDPHPMPWIPGFWLAPDEHTAVLNLHGPLVHHATITNALRCLYGGGTCYEWCHQALDWAADDARIGRIVLAIDSPGGEHFGCGDLAEKIRSINDRAKPVVAHVAGYGASAAYWIASAAGELVASDSAMVGCIGSLQLFYDDTAMLEKLGIKEYTFVSEQSPRKVPDPATPEGKAQIQEAVNAAADQFIAAVAKFRDTTPLRVMEDFGQGDTIIAGEARKLGMIDRVGSLASVLSEPIRARRTARASAVPMRAVASGTIQATATPLRMR